MTRTPDAPATLAPATTPMVRGALGRGRTWIVLAAIVLAGAVLVLIVQGGARPPGHALGADNPAPDGAMALVEVLRANGVEVEPVGTIDEAERLADAGATVLLFDEQLLLDGERLDRLARSGADLVVVRPDLTMLERLAPGVRLGGLAAGPLDDPDCAVEPARRAGRLSDGIGVLRIDEAAAEGFTGCFPDGDGGDVLVTGETNGGGRLSLTAATELFANETVDLSGNAALAIGLTGSTTRLAWYLPTLADVDGEAAPSLAELTPGWVSPVLFLGVAVAVWAAVWRGRRFGRLVVEELPVIVPAGETSEGRARLYERAGARERALDQLRLGSVRRLAGMLGLGSGEPVEGVSDAAAAAARRGREATRSLLIGAIPGHDGQLVELARELEGLEAAVREAVSPAGAGRPAGSPSAPGGPSGPGPMPDPAPHTDPDREEPRR